ncbi:MAG: thioredoxin fold domain-containing protein [Zoogloeaceae bacterium]|jgi:protein SCO1/2|nr:thioredoxin fold domain-containing protein [Zoogloeaceae bacterium]
MLAGCRFPCRRFFPVIALAVCAFLAPGAVTAAIFSIPATDLPAEVKAAKAEGRRLLVFFELSDCPECRTMEREVFSDRRVQRQFDRLYRTARIAVDTKGAIVDLDGEARAPLEIARKLTVYATPSFAFFLPDGTLEYRHTGNLSADEFLRLGQFVFGAIYEEQSFADYAQSSAHH